MNSAKIMLSVVIPCYNAEKTLRECVASVVSECEANILDYEVILVNDGSTDESLAVCTELAGQNPHITVLSQENAGPSAARNNGIRQAQGDLIALNDADDKWVAGKLRAQLDYLAEHPDVDFVCARYGCGKVGKTQVITYKKEIFHNFLSPPSSVLRRSVCEKCMFPEKQKFSEDMHFLLDVMTGHKCVYMAIRSTVPVFEKRAFGESGLSAHLWQMEEGELRNICYAWKLKKIPLALLVCALTWSFAKYVRRCAVSFSCKVFVKKDKERAV